MACVDFGDELTCSICLNIYTDPVTLTCGHNFCRECIEITLDTQERSGAHTCPDCRAEFPTRPTLHRNVALSNIAERFQSTRMKQVSTGVLCTYCIHSSTPAIKSCLHCEASLCDSHLIVHNKSEEHVLTDPNVLQENKRCTIHDKVLQYYCPKDKVCICLLCRMAGVHDGHQVEPLDKASEKKKEKLEDLRKKIIQNREETEERLQTLKEQQHKLQNKISEETESVAALFRNLRTILDEMEKTVLRCFSERKDVSLISDLIRDLDIKKDEMYRKIGLLEELCHMSDPWSFLQEPQSNKEDFYVVEENFLEENLEVHEDELRDIKLSQILYEQFKNLMLQSKKLFFGKEKEADLSLDVRSAGINVEISDDLKVASWSQIKQLHPGARPNLHRCQVLGTQLFSSGQHYWDVETSKSGTWSLGVGYRSMPRSGDMAEIGYNNKSWCLSKVYNCSSYSVMHNDEEIQVHQESPCYKFRLHLDYEAGKLSLYELNDPIRLLYVITATFREPLYPAFYVCNAWVRIQN
ncbi:E3 ubiquitin/ISG15 ligase TRIM25-like [Engystomops pustulosus]|uniref:E3 ubiquitin/ISG15 ligase TRIM25-like n=1 Tax=Engystomops pustulosus TaxID=76066 RepID=UPI003AFB2067